MPASSFWEGLLLKLWIEVGSFREELLTAEVRGRLALSRLDHGVDVSIHALTKYPGGHSDILMGSVSANAACAPILKDAMRDLGLCVSGDDAYQVLRGLRTMGIRLERHRESALELADRHPFGLVQVASAASPRLKTPEADRGRYGSRSCASQTSSGSSARTRS